MDKGYHVLLEKPISPDLGECLQLQRKAQETGRTVVVCHVLRYAPFYAAIKDLLDKGALTRTVHRDPCAGLPAEPPRWEVRR